MTTQRLALMLTLANLVLAAFLVSHAHPVNAGVDGGEQVLRP
jgi:hypothetical protein